MAGKRIVLLAALLAGCASFPRGQLGVLVDQTGGALTVESVREGGPAEGVLKPGDAIVAVDGKSINAWDIDQALSTMRGPEGSIAVVRVMRRGQYLELAVVRRALKSPGKGVPPELAVRGLFTDEDIRNLGEEESAFALAAAAKSCNGWDRYLLTWPNGETALRAKLRREETCWEEARADGSPCALRDFAARFPASKKAPEALALAESAAAGQLLAAHAEGKAAREEAIAFLDAHPQSAKAPEVRGILEDLEARHALADQRPEGPLRFLLLYPRSAQIEKVGARLSELEQPLVAAIDLPLVNALGVAVRIAAGGAVTASTTAGGGELGKLAQDPAIRRVLCVATAARRIAAEADQHGEAAQQLRRDLDAALAAADPSRCTFEEPAPGALALRALTALANLDHKRNELGQALADARALAKAAQRSGSLARRAWIDRHEEEVRGDEGNTAMKWQEAISALGLSDRLPDLSKEGALRSDAAAGAASESISALSAGFRRIRLYAEAVERSTLLLLARRAP